MSAPLTVVFIAAVAAGAGYVATKKTVAKGHVMAADLTEQLRSKGISGMTCDDHIPIGPTGAVFRCQATGTDGSTATIEYAMDRGGSLSGSVVESSGPSEPRIPPSSDPWAN